MGVVIGAMLNRALIQRRITRAFALSNPKTFSLWYENRLDLNQEQSRQIKTILDEHAQTVWEIREDFIQEMQIVSQALHSELEPLLTPEQKRLLNRGPFSPRRIAERGFRPPKPDWWGSMFFPELQGLREALSLTDKQVNQLRSQMEIQSRPPMAAGRRMQNPESLLLFWQERENQKDLTFQKILDEDQKKIYARLKEERRQKLIHILEKLTQDK